MCQAAAAAIRLRAADDLSAAASVDLLLPPCVQPMIERGTMYRAAAAAMHAADDLSSEPRAELLLPPCEQVMV